jgi:hypothetical protein
MKYIVFVLLIGIGGAIWFLALNRNRNPNSIALPFSLEPDQAVNDAERNIRNGEFRLPIVITESGLKYAPFLDDPKSYSAVAGGHAIQERQAAPGVIMKYAENYWSAFLPTLEKSGKMEYYTEKLNKASEIKK